MKPLTSLTFDKISFVRAACTEHKGLDAGLAAWWFTDNLPQSAELPRAELLKSFEVFLKRQQGQL